MQITDNYLYAVCSGTFWNVFAVASSSRSKTDYLLSRQNPPVQRAPSFSLALRFKPTLTFLGGSLKWRGVNLSTASLSCPLSASPHQTALVSKAVISPRPPKEVITQVENGGECKKATIATSFPIITCPLWGILSSSRLITHQKWARHTFIVFLASFVHFNTIKTLASLKPSLLDFINWGAFNLQRDVVLFKRGVSLSLCLVNFHLSGHFSLINWDGETFATFPLANRGHCSKQHTWVHMDDWHIWRTTSPNETRRWH